MTERLADISARIEGMHQLSAVVNAIKGIAAARARAARAQVEAVDRYTAMISNAMACSLGSVNTDITQHPSPQEASTAMASGNTGLLLFLGEQGFAGAFSERVLDSVGDVLASVPLLVIGTRGLSITATRGLTPLWSASMPSHSLGIPTLADDITHVIYAALSNGDIDRLEIVHARWSSGQPQVERRLLLPIEPQDIVAPDHGTTGDSPLMQLPRDTLLASLGQDYVHARICKAALHAFAAENEARMEAMSSAANQIESELEDFKAKLRQVRQESITAEIIELGTGAAAGNP